MRLSNQLVRHTAWLARLGLSEAEVERFSFQLSNILENFEILKEVDTSNVPPTARIGPQQNVLREDMAAESYSPDEILANAPVKEDNCFKVRAILE